MMKINIISYVSLGVGFLIGALAQSSRMCFIGGWRDFFLIRDKYLLKGFFSFLITAALLFFVFYSAGSYLKNYPWFDRPPAKVAAVDLIWAHDELPEIRKLEYCELTMVDDVIVGVDTAIPGLVIGNIKIPNEILMYLFAAFIIGLFSTIANGCPLRQHVMASSGNASAMAYLLGFYVEVLVFDGFLVKYLDMLVN